MEKKEIHIAITPELNVTSAGGESFLSWSIYLMKHKAGFGIGLFPSSIWSVVDRPQRVKFSGIWLPWYYALSCDQQYVTKKQYLSGLF